MDTMSHLLPILLGSILVFLVFYDVFHSIIVPRVSPYQFRIAPYVGRKLLFPIYVWVASRNSFRKWRDDLLGLYAPLFFAILILLWLVTLILGFALLFYGFREDFRPPIASFNEAIYFAGSSVLTLGFGDIVAFGTRVRFLVLIAAVSGLSYMALSISYLFTLQSLVQQREQVVNTVVSRAGTPASGIVLLLRYKELGLMSTMGTSFISWESWVASILESHRAYPLLLYFRSTNQTESWISVMGAMLDAASLLLTTIKDVSVGEAELFYWLACSTAQALCKAFRIETTDHVRLDKEQFQHGLEILKAGGFEIRDESLSWKLFQIRRKAYMGYLSALADEFSSPMHSWIYDLSTAATDRERAAQFQPRV